VVAYLDSIVATLLLNDPLAVDNEPEVAYAELLTLSIELLNAEPVTSKAETLVLNDPLAADSEPDVADSDPELAYAELLTVYNDALVVLNELVVVNTVLSNPSNVSALAAYDADKAFDPEITPVVVIAPDELMLMRVVEPLTNVTFPVEEICMTLVRFDAD